MSKNNIIQKDRERERSFWNWNRKWKRKQREKDFNIKWETGCEMTVLPFVSGLGIKLPSKFSGKWIRGVGENFELGR